MYIRNIVKKAGRLFVSLHFRNYEILDRIALLIDHEAISKEHLNLLLENTKKNFPYTHMVLLSYESRREYLGDVLSEVEIKFVPERIWTKGVFLLVALWGLRKRNFDFIVLPRLDILPLVYALFLTRAEVLLYNQYNQWWKVRQRTLGDWFRVIEAPFEWLVKVIGAVIVVVILIGSLGLLGVRRFFSIRKT